MSDIESRLIVTKVVETNSDERSFAVTLKGSKTVVHQDGGFDIEDAVDIQVTLKFGMESTLRRLSVEAPGFTRMLLLRAVDTTLAKFGDTPEQKLEA